VTLLLLLTRQPARHIAIVSLLLVLPLRELVLGQDRSAPSAHDIAERIVSEVVAKPLGTTRTEWRARNPGATWREFVGERGHAAEQSTYRWPDGAWCVIADDDRNGLHRQAVFRGMHAAIKDCSLTQLTVTYEPPAVSSLKLSELYGELIVALTRQYGYGSPSRLDMDLPKAEAERRFPGSPREGFFQWYSATFEVHLFTHPGTGVGIVIRDGLYEDTKERAEGLGPRGDLREKLFDRVRQTYPEAMNIILGRSGVVDEPAAIAIAARMLNAVERSSVDDDRAWQALAAEEVILRLLLSGNPAELPAMKPLAPFNLVFLHEGHGEVWYYQRGLSEAVIRRHPQSPWGQSALVQKIVRGWTVAQCEDSYRDVATHGQDWLARNPASPYRLVVTRAVAAAYQTWWSLSKAPEYDDLAFASKEDAMKGAAAARLRAIEWNERLLSELPAGLPHPDIDRTIVHLHADVDTGAREYHCVEP
jgi:hypothetical protein